MSGAVTGDPARVEQLRRALAVDTTADELGELLHEDVTVWAPGAQVSSLQDLVAELRVEDELLAELDARVDAIDVVGDRGYAEWTLSAIHAGAVRLDDEVVAEATGAPVTVRGITAADFAGDRIASLRHYWDEVGMLEGLGLLPADPGDRD